MESRERVLAALRREQPDRVPVIEFIVDEKIWSRAAPGAADMADAMDRLDMDGVGCGAFFARVEEGADGTYRDEWGVEYRCGVEAVAHPLLRRRTRRAGWAICPIWSAATRAGGRFVSTIARPSCGRPI